MKPQNIVSALTVTCTGVSSMMRSVLSARSTGTRIWPANSPGLPVVR